MTDSEELRSTSAQGRHHRGRVRGTGGSQRLAGKSVDVTIVDQRNYHTFQPLLYEVATAGLDPADVGYPVRAAFGRTPNVHFRLGMVTQIEWDERTVCFSGINDNHDSASDACADDIPFDSLIVASGAVVNFFGVPGAEEHALPLYTLEDARHCETTSSCDWRRLTGRVPIPPTAP